MSGQPAGRLTAIPAWVRYGVIAGILAFVCTVAANLIITAVGPPTGVAGIFNAAVMITIGTGLAAGAAALGGLLGVATRSGAGTDRSR